MLPDAEILRITTEILDSLNLGSYTIKINHRKILDGLFQVCGVPIDKIRSISSAVDKLDKVGRVILCAGVVANPCLLVRLHGKTCVKR